MAEEVGFEPTESLHPQRFSRPPPSTTRPFLRGHDEEVIILSLPKFATSERSIGDIELNLRCRTPDYSQRFVCL
jgi:hypothetical protein